MYVCMYVCMNVCMYVCMYIRMLIYWDSLNDACADDARVPVYSTYIHYIYIYIYIYILYMHRRWMS